MGNLYMEASQINYRGGEKKMSVEEALKNTSGEAAAIAQLQHDVSDLNDVKANKITIAPAFSAEASYDPGDLVYYNGLTYRCVNAHSGEWDADDFAGTTIANELSTLESGLNGFNDRTFFGGFYGKYYRTAESTIDGIVDGVISATSDDLGYFSVENKASIVGFGNRQFVFGWTNAEKTFAWIVVCSFNGISVGTRANASTFTFVSLTS